MTNFKTRLNRLETNQCQDFAKALSLIDEKEFYDELTDSEKDIYCDYHGIEREAVEECEKAVTGSLHFRLERKPKPPTPKELQSRIAEIEDEILKGE